MKNLLKITDLRVENVSAFLTTKATKDFDALLKLTIVRIKEHNSF
ncbi:hypothetical protein [Chryseobacterium mucoviscidosis]